MLITATAQAAGPTVLFNITGRTFHHLYKQMPGQYGILMLNIARDLSRRLRQLDAGVVSYAPVTIEGPIDVPGEPIERHRDDGVRDLGQRRGDLGVGRHRHHDLAHPPCRCQEPRSEGE